MSELRIVDGLVPRPVSHENGSRAGGDDSRGTARTSTATELVEIAKQMYQFGISTAGDTYAIPIDGPRVASSLRGGTRSLRARLARAFFERTGRVAPQQALADAILVVEGIAAYADAKQLHLRVAEHDGELWLDLGDDNGAAVRITGTGWWIEQGVPVLFKRTNLTGILSVENQGSGCDLDALWNWVHVDPEDRVLVLAWLVASLFPNVPHPILGLFGEQGTGKSTASKKLVSLIDPSPVLVRKPPRDSEGWVTAAAGSWVVTLDNLSEISPWLSDSLCRAVTGDGDVRRKLYSDSDLTVFAFRRCIIVNGIDVGATHGDLAERLLPIELSRIGADVRLDEQDMATRWSIEYPAIVAGLLDLTARVVRILPAIDLASRPRMADYAGILAAVDHELGTAGLVRYIEKQSTLASDSLTDDVFITAIRDLGNTFEGTAVQLLEQVTPNSEPWRAPKSWPPNARAVTQRLKRQAPTMRKAGWTIENHGANNKTHATVWTITAPTRDTANRTSPSSPYRIEASKASQASNKARPSQYDGSAFHQAVVALRRELAAEEAHDDA